MLLEVTPSFATDTQLAWSQEILSLVALLILRAYSYFTHKYAIDPQNRRDLPLRPNKRVRLVHMPLRIETTRYHCPCVRNPVISLGERAKSA
jgi:hypothetical protein